MKPIRLNLMKDFMINHPNFYLLESLNPIKLPALNKFELFYLHLGFID